MKWALLLKPENIGVTMTLIKSMYNLTYDATILLLHELSLLGYIRQ